MSAEELFTTGFPSFAQGTIVSGDENACRQGKGSIIEFALVEQSVASAFQIELDKKAP